MSHVAGTTGIGESQYQAKIASIANTGIGSEDKCRDDRSNYVNDTLARQTSIFKQKRKVVNMSCKYVICWWWKL